MYMFNICFRKYLGNKTIYYNKNKGKSLILDKMQELINLTDMTTSEYSLV